MFERPVVESNEQKPNHQQSEEKDLTAALAKIDQLEVRVQELSEQLGLLRAQQANWADVITTIGLQVAALEERKE